MDDVIRALADPTRREILRMLREAPRNAGAVARAFSVSRPAVSRHLRVLREAGLVQDELVGRERAYRATLDVLEPLEAFLGELRAPTAWERRMMALDTEVHRVRRRNAAARDDSSEPDGSEPDGSEPDVSEPDEPEQESA